MKSFLLLVISVLMLLSCSTFQQNASKYSQMSTYVKNLPSIKKQSQTAEGSLWNSSDGSLYSNVRAYMVGDLVTIMVDEITSSNNTSTTKISSSSSSSSGLTNLFGVETNVFRALNIPRSGTKNGYTVPAGGSSNDLLGFGSKNGYQGQGQNKQQSSLTATITARVIKVLPDHKLFIRGEREIYSNGEAQALILTGIIDARSISSDDTINSSQIADAKIYYNGKGIISNTTKEGWLAELWNLVKPF